MCLFTQFSCEAQRQDTKSADELEGEGTGKSPWCHQGSLEPYEKLRRGWGNPANTSLFPWFLWKQLYTLPSTFSKDCTLERKEEKETHLEMLFLKRSGVKNPNYPLFGILKL